MSYSQKRISFFLLAVFFSAMIFFGAGGADGRLVRASFLDMIQAVVAINPLEIEVSAPSEVEAGSIFRVQAKVINGGEEKVEEAKAEIFLPAGLSLRGRGAAQNIGVIQGGKNRKADWRVRADNAGNYIIVVSASGKLKGETISADGNKVVKVTDKEKERGDERRSPPSRRQLRFFQDLFSFLNLWLGQ
jgi:hypothetical protein